MVTNLVYAKYIAPYVSRKGEGKEGGFELHIQSIDNVSNDSECGQPVDKIWLKNDLDGQLIFKKVRDNIPCTCDFIYDTKIFNGRPYSYLKDVNIVQDK